MEHIIQKLLEYSANQDKYNLLIAEQECNAVQYYPGIGDICLN